jgi:hypothetical protein
MKKLTYCEFSISSFIIVTENEIPVAAFGGWIEAMPGEMPSKLLKSNLSRIYFKERKPCFFKN